MPLPVIAGVHRVALAYRDLGGATAANVFHLAEGAGGPRTAAQVCADVSAAWVAAQNNLMATSSAVVSITDTPLDGVSASSVLAVSAAKFSGQVGAQPIPAQAAILSLRTSLRGPRRRGRLYLPFIGEAVTNAGVLDAANVASTAAGWASFVSTLGGLAVPLDMGVASYVGASFRILASLTVEGVAGTQRRRQSRLR